MRPVNITREIFLEDRQGRTFADVVDDTEQPFEEVLEFFSDADRQRRMEEAEEKIRVIQKWLGTLEHKTLVLLQPCARMSTLLSTQSPKALARLDQMLDSLDDYLRKSPSTGA